MNKSGRKQAGQKRSVTSYAEIKAIMRAILDDEPLTDVLEKIAHHIEDKLPNTRTSILLFDPIQSCLNLGAAPSMQEEYNALMKGLKIGPDVATCGTTAYTRSMVVVRDVYTDRLWKDYVEIAKQFNIRACWSIPVFNMKNELMGTIALYYEKKHKPIQKEMILMRELVDIVCLAIERDHSRLLKKQNAEELAEQRVHAMNSLRYASLGEMAGNIAHEINSPLAIISGTIHQLNRIVEAEEVSVDKMMLYMHRLNRSVGRIERIIKGMRSITRDSSQDQFTKVSISSVVEDVTAICSERFKDYNVDLRLTGDLEAMIECRPTQISQVILNLVRNSFEAIEKKEDSWIEIRVSRAHYVVRIEVEDCGYGIPTEIVEKLMTPLFTTKKESLATGLGLSISLAFVRDHSGKIWYDKESKHTRFVIELPVEQVPSLKQAA
jgi:signal transduction histidine kinase